MTTQAITIRRPATIKTQTLAVGTAVVAALVLPQAFHALGVVSGTVFGQAFLPMYLPIILVGFFAGAIAGSVSGLLAPVASFALSGMPSPVLLPCITAELIALGFAAGLLRDAKMPVIGKVLLAQVAGKAAYAVVVLLAVYAFGSETLTAGSIWGSIQMGLPGFALQWALVPLILFYLAHRKNLEE
jgi:hypothetical protein